MLEPEYVLTHSVEVNNQLFHCKKSFEVDENQCAAMNIHATMQFQQPERIRLPFHRGPPPPHTHTR